MPNCFVVKLCEYKYLPNFYTFARKITNTSKYGKNQQFGVQQPSSTAVESLNQTKNHSKTKNCSKNYKQLHEKRLKPLDFGQFCGYFSLKKLQTSFQRSTA